MDRRLLPLLGLAVLGCTAAAFAAVGGSGMLVGAILSVITLVLFSILYQTGRLGAELPPARVSRTALVRLGWVVVAILWGLALLAIVRLLSTSSPEQFR